MSNRSLNILKLSLILIPLCGCEHVKPLERSYLAKENMNPNPYPMESTLQVHAYESREGVAGGMGTAKGSDCGCN